MYYYDVAFSKLHPDAVLPTRGTPDSVGLDLYTLGEHVVPPRGLARLSTGLRFARKLPEPALYGYLMEAQVRARSSTFKQFGLTIPNAPGTIDPDYTGEILIQVLNHRDEAVTIPTGTRLAQLVFGVVPYIRPVESTIDTSQPERSGFGSTGV